MGGSITVQDYATPARRASARILAGALQHAPSRSNLQSPVFVVARQISRSRPFPIGLRNPSQSGQLHRLQSSMNHLLHGVARALCESFPFTGPVLEIGSYQVPGQE